MLEYHRPQGQLLGRHPGIRDRTAQNGVWMLDDFDGARSEYQIAIPNIVHSNR